MQEMAHRCPGWQRRVRVPKTNTPHAKAPTNPVCLQQEEGQDSQPEVEEAEEDAAVPSPVSVCPDLTVVTDPAVLFRGAWPAKSCSNHCCCNHWCRDPAPTLPPAPALMPVLLSLHSRRSSWPPCLRSVWVDNILYI